MAIFYPPLEHSKNFSQKLTDGEYSLLRFLEYLDDSYEIFYQSYVNGLRPDIAIIKKNHGVLLIEVKDWNLSLYNIDHNGLWTLIQNGAKLRSPEKQVIQVKNALFDLYIPNLLEKKIQDSRFYKIISCAVYFHTDFIKEGLKPHNSFITFLYKNKLSEGIFDNLLKRHCMYFSSPPSLFFSDEIYDECLRIFNPPTHLLEEGSTFEYTKKQQQIINSANNNRSLKVKGFAGGGKTTLLAQIAVNAHKRTANRVLILSFNITLRSYIHDKISRIRAKFSWDAFEVNHYHGFLLNFFHNREELISGLEIYDLPLQYIPEDVEKYDTIFIDEIQDYKKMWVLNIKQFLRDPNSGLIVFGDEKQNIYDRDMIVDDNYRNVPYTSIGGQWNFLNENHRLSSDIGKLVANFQQRLKLKYEISEISIEQPELIFDNSTVQYHFFPQYTEDVLKNIVKLSNDFIQINTIHDGDVCFLSESIGPIRDLDDIFTEQYKKRTCTTFESQIIFELLKQKYYINIPIRIDDEDLEIEKIIPMAKIREAIAKLKNTEVLKYISDILMKENNSSTINFYDLKKIYKQLSQYLPNDKGIETTAKNIKLFEKELNDVRRSKKFNFQPKNGLLKLSTIHSFKGWESHTLFLIISNKVTTKTTEELIYTALSRAKNNLIIYNLGNVGLNDFFQNNV